MVVSICKVYQRHAMLMNEVIEIGLCLVHKHSQSSSAKKVHGSEQ